MRLAVRAVPLKFELACPMKPLDDAPNRLCVQIRATNRPWRAGSDLFLLQQAGLHEALNSMVTDTTHPSRFAQADSFRIGSRSFLTRNRRGVPGRGHSVLIPLFPLARAISEAVQYGRNLIVTVANGHPTNDLQCFHGRCRVGRGARPLHLELRVRTAFPVDGEL